MIETLIDILLLSSIVIAVWIAIDHVSLASIADWLISGVKTIWPS